MTQREEQTPSDWWRTAIIDMSPGVIRMRGYPIEQLIGQVSLAGMVWLMTRGELPTPAQAALLESALVAGVDHGPQAPSIAVARMAMTCGVGLNNAMASAINTLGDIHGGAGEQALELFDAILASVDAGLPLEQATRAAIDAKEADGIRFVPGFGHRFHPVDPRVAPLLAAVERAREAGEVSGRVAEVASAVGDEIERRKGRRITMNIDGVTAVIYGELGFAAPLARGLFCLSRSVGILAHAWEQRCEGGRNKGPIPRHLLWTYDGPTRRDLPSDGARHPAGAEDP
ncbi:MAG: citryl-CoA lyase [Burkholderiaceae bacterium]|nr:citryl-CoA lyase [Burkholderiaceae bacterium]